MYYSFFKLKRNPFHLDPDPNFLWLSATHKEALSIMQHCLMDQKGFAVITGDVGAGKSTLINSFLEILGDDIVVVKITNPPSEVIDLFNLLASLLKIEGHFKNKSEFIQQISNYIKENSTKQLLIVIDEAHRLSHEQFEELRLITNISPPGKNRITFFFIGQNELNHVLLNKKCHATRSRISCHYHIAPLSGEEIKNYISFRLLIAGTNRSIFTEGALKTIYRLSKGNPRRINMICDKSLMLAYKSSKKSVTAKIIKKCSHNLLIPGEKQSGGAFTSIIFLLVPFKATFSFLQYRIVFLANTLKDYGRFLLDIPQCLFRKKVLAACVGGMLVLLFFGTKHNAFLNKREAANDSIYTTTNIEQKKQSLSDQELSQDDSEKPNSLSEDTVTKKIARETRPQHTIYPEEILNTKQNKPSSATIAQQIHEKKKEKIPSDLANRIQSFIDDHQYSQVIKLIEQTKNEDELSGNQEKINHLYIKALRGKSKQLLKEKKKRDAIKLLLEAISLDEENPLLYFDAGKIFSKMGRYAKSIEMYGKSIELDPTFPGTYYNLGYIYFIKENYKLSEKMFKHSVKLAPPYLDKALFNLAVVQFLQGKRKQCIESLKKTLSVNSDNRKAKNMLDKIENLQAKHAVR